VANPLGVNVVFDGTPKDDPNITLDIPDMEPSTATPGYQGIAGPCEEIGTGTGSACATDGVTTVTVVFRQNAGITNATEAEAGFDAAGQLKGRDVKVQTSNEGQVAAAAEYRIFIPRLIEINDATTTRGQVITVTGKGFANGTTATIWRDADADGTRDAGEVDLGQAEVASDDTFTFSLTVSVPPFVIGDDGTGGAGNYINAIDGDSNTVVDVDGGSSAVTLPITSASLSQNIPEIEMQGSMSVTPTEASIGDTIQITIKDFLDVTWTATATGTVGAPKMTLGGILVDTPAVNPNANGEATFNMTIPNGVASGTQQLKINASTTYAVNSPTKDLIISGANLTITPETNLVPNQTVTVIGSGFSGSSSISAALTDDSSVLIDGSATGLKGAGTTADGSVGASEKRTKINEGSSVTTDNGGNWSSSIILPINDATTTPGTHELKITDVDGRSGTVDLVISDRTLVLEPLESRVGTTVTVTGTGYPADNTKTGAESTPSVSIRYTVSGTAQTVATLTPDASGNITGTFTVPLNTGIPSTNSVTAEFDYTPTGGAQNTNVTGVTHKVPKATVTIDPDSGPTGTTVTIIGAGFKTYSTLSDLTLGGIDVRPAPVPSTDSEGGFTTTVIVPQSNTGSQSVTATVATTVATDTFTVVAAVPTAIPSPVVAAQAPADALAALISNNDNLVRVWHFDPSQQNEAPGYGWSMYDPRPVFAAANSVDEIAGGQFYWINVQNAQTAVLGGASRSLFAGWNPVTW